MSGLLLCTKQAVNPLYVENGSIRIYNLEELCYYLYNYTYMITADFFDEKFIMFCENELEQVSLAQKIKECIAHKQPLRTFIMRVLESAYFYSTDELKKFETTLAYLDSTSVKERMKARADMMVKAGKLKSAMAIYKSILDNKEEIMSLQFNASVKSNIGVIYTELFMYDKAAEYFEMAYDIDPIEEYRDFLVCALMMLGDEERLHLITSRYHIDEEIVNEYKLAFSNVNKMVRSSDKYKQFTEQFKYDSKKSLNLYYENITHILSGWKEDYRKAIDA
ncbi:MAG: hypothetical protein J6L69_10840 [Lachnospiraceae bacterium]|nr:hypothetical protein [Lachnospiraceae bacterium]